MAHPELSVLHVCVEAVAVDAGHHRGTGPPYRRCGPPPHCAPAALTCTRPSSPSQSIAGPNGHVMSDGIVFSPCALRGRGARPGLWWCWALSPGHARAPPLSRSWRCLWSMLACPFWAVPWRASPGHTRMCSTGAWGVGRGAWGVGRGGEEW